MKRNPHERVVCALFKTRDEVHKALDALAPTGLPTEDISVIMNEDVFEEEEFSEIAGVKMHDESVHAAKVGGVAGGVLAGLTALAGMVVGGTALLAAGPIVAAIAGFGALLGTLIGAGFTEEQAKKIDEAMKRGRIMVAIHTSDHHTAREAEKILRGHQPEEVHHF